MKTIVKTERTEDELGDYYTVIQNTSLHKLTLKGELENYMRKLNKLLLVDKDKYSAEILGNFLIHENKEYYVIKLLSWVLYSLFRPIYLKYSIKGIDEHPIYTNITDIISKLKLSVKQVKYFEILLNNMVNDFTTIRSNFVMTKLNKGKFNLRWISSSTQKYIIDIYDQKYNEFYGQSLIKMIKIDTTPSFFEKLDSYGKGEITKLVNISTIFLKIYLTMINVLILEYGVPFMVNLLFQKKAKYPPMYIYPAPLINKKDIFNLTQLLNFDNKWKKDHWGENLDVFLNVSYSGLLYVLQEETVRGRDFVNTRSIIKELLLYTFMLDPFSYYNLNFAHTSIDSIVAKIKVGNSKDLYNDSTFKDFDITELGFPKYDEKNRKNEFFKYSKLKEGYFSTLPIEKAKKEMFIHKVFLNTFRGLSMEVLQNYKTFTTKTIGNFYINRSENLSKLFKKFNSIRDELSNNIFDQHTGFHLKYRIRSFRETAGLNAYDMHVMLRKIIDISGSKFDSVRNSDTIELDSDFFIKFHNEFSNVVKEVIFNKMRHNWLRMLMQNELPHLATLFVYWNRFYNFEINKISMFRIDYWYRVWMLLSVLKNPGSDVLPSILKINEHKSLLDYCHKIVKDINDSKKQLSFDPINTLNQYTLDYFRNKRKILKHFMMNSILLHHVGQNVLTENYILNTKSKYIIFDPEVFDHKIYLPFIRAPLVFHVLHSKNVHSDYEQFFKRQKIKERIPVFSNIFRSESIVNDLKSYTTIIPDHMKKLYTELVKFYYDASSILVGLKNKEENTGIVNFKNKRLTGRIQSFVNKFFSKKEAITATKKEITKEAEIITLYKSANAIIKVLTQIFHGKTNFTEQTYTSNDYSEILKFLFGQQLINREINPKDLASYLFYLKMKKREEYGYINAKLGTIETKLKDLIIIPDPGANGLLYTLVVFTYIYGNSLFFSKENNIIFKQGLWKNYQNNILTIFPFLREYGARDLVILDITKQSILKLEISKSHKQSGKTRLKYLQKHMEYLVRVLESSFGKKI